MALLASPVSGVAQAPAHEIDLALTYAAERSGQLGGAPFWRQGGAVEISAEVYRGLGVAASITGLEAGEVGSTGVGLDTVTALVGPRYSYRGRQWSVFGEGLLGVAHAWDTQIPDESGAASSGSSFAVQMGGGLEMSLGQARGRGERKRVAFRPIQVEWVRTGFGNGEANKQHDLRLGTGVVWRLRQ